MALWITFLMLFVVIEFPLVVSRSAKGNPAALAHTGP